MFRLRSSTKKENIPNVPNIALYVKHNILNPALSVHCCNFLSECADEETQLDKVDVPDQRSIEGGNVLRVVENKKGKHYIT